MDRRTYERLFPDLARIQPYVPETPRERNARERVAHAHGNVGGHDANYNDEPWQRSCK
jgi:hypothetical protein